MVQLNPLKWGRESRKKRKEELKVKQRREKLTAITQTTGGGASGARKRMKAKWELGAPDRAKKKAAQKDKKDRIAYDRKHQITNRRGRVIGYKEGHDPSKGVQKKTTTKTTSKSKSTSKSTSKKDPLAGIKARAAARHSDWKKMRSGSMSKDDFIKKHPDSVTARKAKKKYRR